MFLHILKVILIFINLEAYENIKKIDDRDYVRPIEYLINRLKLSKYRCLEISIPVSHFEVL